MNKNFDLVKHGSNCQGHVGRNVIVCILAFVIMETAQSGETSVLDIKYLLQCAHQMRNKSLVTRPHCDILYI